MVFLSSTYRCGRFWWKINLKSKIQLIKSIYLNHQSQLISQYSQAHIKCDYYIIIIHTFLFMEQAEYLLKFQVTEIFQNAYKQQTNLKCISCSFPQTDTWVSINNGVFLCSKCADQCRNMRQSICQLKSIKLGLWTQKQTKFIRKGGNRRYFNFMQKYGLNDYDFKYMLCTRAGVYYRQMLSRQVLGKQQQEPPSHDAGRQLIIKDTSPNFINLEKAEDFLQVTKLKFLQAYQATKEATSNASAKIQQKINGPKIKKQLKSFGQKTKQFGDQLEKSSKQTADSFKFGWFSFTSKFEQIFK